MKTAEEFCSARHSVVAATLSRAFHVLAASALLFGWTKSSAEPLVVRYSDQSKYRDTGILRFIVDAKEDGNPIEGLESGLWGLRRGERKVEVRFTASPFKKSGSSTSVLIVIAANTNFIPPAEEEGTDGKPLKKPIVYVVDALNSLRNNLDPYLVSVACYDEVRPDPEIIHTSKVASKIAAFTPEDIESRCRPVEEGAGMPRLPTLLQSAAQKWLRQPKPETLRYVMVVFTDGNSKEPVQQDWLRSILNRFGSEIRGWFELYVVGLEDGGDRPNLQALAHGGVLVSTASRENIPQEAARIMPLVAGVGLYDVQFTVLERVKGASVPLTLTVQTSDGQTLASAPYTLINLERKTGWLDILLIALAVIGAVIALLLIVKLIGAVVEARRRRREEAALASVQFRGPSKGRLIVRDGPAAGTTYYLTEDITYIGRSPDNHITIPDPSVGKRHASITIRDRTYEIEDLQSTNGVFVNGQRILKAYLKDGDSIRLGATEMQFRL